MQVPRFRMRKWRAESLIETVISATVIVIASAAALGLLRTSLIGNDVIGTKVIAMNLALEGIESVKNIRDTNYLRFASDPDNCWNKLDIVDVSECDDVGVSAIEDDTFYYLTRSMAAADRMEWNMVPAVSRSDGNLDLYEMDTDGDGTYDAQIYAQNGIVTPFMSSVESGIYNRVIYISYISPNSFSVESKVTWISRNITKDISFKRVIGHVL